MKINFKLDMEKDFENYYEAVNDKKRYSLWTKSISQKILKLIGGKSKDEAYQNVLPILKLNYNIYEKYFNIFLKQVEEYWQEVGSKFTERFENLTGNKFSFDEVTVYLTTIQRCPYNYGEKWFMISFLEHPLSAVKIICHELMHFHFIDNNWNNIEKEIGKEKTDNLKEALTVLLNLEFKDLLFFEDRGYEEHKKLREFIKIEWEKEKDYDKLIHKCILFLENEN